MEAVRVGEVEQRRAGGGLRIRVHGREGVAIELAEEALAAVDAQSRQGDVRHRVVGESGPTTGHHVAGAGHAAGEDDENVRVRVERLRAGGEVGDQLRFVRQPGLSGDLVVPWRDPIGAELDLPAILAEDRRDPIAEDLGRPSLRQIETVDDRRRGRPRLACGLRPGLSHQQDGGGKRGHLERATRASTNEGAPCVHEILPILWKNRHVGPSLPAARHVAIRTDRLCVHWTIPAFFGPT